ncbi:PPE family protein [Mycobacterium sp.]|uniref:PPE family protein n=1 Tax=Mycobacterium sp. TaxID=1785 RepID=UPI003BA8C2AC
MDYAFLPPEINSARMYSGPGPGSFLTAAGNWDSLAAELASVADSYSSSISTLASISWRGPAAAAMLAKSLPFVDWLYATAAQTKQTAGKARAAAAAFERAYTMTVPPALVVGNRATLKALIASNFFGQNTPAIAATETAYTEMWAQDAAAMYDYAGASAVAAALTPFAEPPETANAGAEAGQAAAVESGASAQAAQSATAQLLAKVPEALSDFQLPNFSFQDGHLPQDLLDIIAALDSSSTVLGTPISAATALVGTIQGSAPAAAVDAVGSGIAAGLAPALATTIETPSVGGVVLAGWQQANSIGQLSVPPSWAAPASGPVNALSGSGLTTLSGGDPIEAGTPGIPGMPAVATRGANGVVPRYGTRLTVMSRPPAAG